MAWSRRIALTVTRMHSIEVAYWIGTERQRPDLTSDSSSLTHSLTSDSSSPTHSLTSDSSSLTPRASSTGKRLSCSPPSRPLTVQSAMEPPVEKYPGLRGEQRLLSHAPRQMHKPSSRWPISSIGLSIPAGNSGVTRAAFRGSTLPIVATEEVRAGARALENGLLRSAHPNMSNTPGSQSPSEICKHPALLRLATNRVRYSSKADDVRTDPGMASASRIAETASGGSVSRLRFLSLTRSA